jgi:4-alpha-glucanotransferase
MILQLSINFHTLFHQRLYVCGTLPEMGGNDTSKAFPMEYDTDDIWRAEIKISNLQDRIISYRYFVRDNEGNTFFEVGKERIIGLNNNSKRLIFNDQWQGNTPDAPFLSDPFSNVFFTHGKSVPTQTHLFTKEIILRVTAPNIEKEADLYLCGDHPELGGWDPEKALPLTPSFGSRWIIHLSANKIEGTILYKFIKKYSDGRNPVWEYSENHSLTIPKIGTHETFSIEHSFAAFNISNPKFTGTALPVFSLRTKNDCGIGDFIDIKLLADWAATTGQNIIQLLPINDTTSTFTWRDSYPYGGISVMALHPIYINIKAVGPFKDKAISAQYNKERKSINALKSIDYEKVLSFKKKYTKILFELYSKDTFAEPDFYSFYKKNKSWLLPYGAFCTLRDRFKTADFTLWGEYSTFSPSIIEKINKKGTATYFSMSYYLFMQYHLHKQLSESVAYAHSRGIAIKGDIPIGITPNSVEAWSEPQLFNMNSQAGAPPDSFSANGQNWGFPTYNWEEMAKDNYSWWKKRLEKMSEYFDAYRIDHVLGFFRIWEIPDDQVKGLMGHFSPALPFKYDELLRWGYKFDYHRDVKPFIRYYMLKEMFPGKEKYVMDTFLESKEYEVFTLKPEFDTQKKIEKYFEDKDDDNLKDGLEALVSEVLFVEDPVQRGEFHPRISAQFTYSYKALSESDKIAYNALYNHFFYKRHNDFWKAKAMTKLPELISATNMLCCAEDLGMIPECVPEVLKILRICTLEIQRMPKDPSVRFADPAHYPYLSVCTTGTHDTSTIRGWWEEDKKMSQEYYNAVLHESGKAPESCEAWICEKIIRQHIHSSSMLTILPIQDWFSIYDEMRTETPDSQRINIPSNPKHYWRYRLNIALEDLLNNKNFNDYLVKVINESK